MTNSMNITLTYKDKKVEHHSMTGRMSPMDAAENKYAGRGLRQQDYKRFCKCDHILDEESLPIAFWFCKSLLNC